MLMQEQSKNNSHKKELGIKEILSMKYTMNTNTESNEYKNIQQNINPKFSVQNQTINED